MKGPTVRRREFLKGTAAVAAATLLRLPLASAQQSPTPSRRREFEVSSSHYAWEIHDENVGKVLDNIQQMAAVNSVYLISPMHPEKRPLTSDAFPHNPVRKTWMAEDSRVYWHPDLKHYGRIKPRLSDHDWLSRTDWVRVLIDAARRRGIKTGVEISHTTIDKERAEGDLADCMQRDIRGQICRQQESRTSPQREVDRPECGQPCLRAQILTPLDSPAGLFDWQLNSAAISLASPLVKQLSFRNRKRPNCHRRVSQAGRGCGQSNRAGFFGSANNNERPAMPGRTMIGLVAFFTPVAAVVHAGNHTRSADAEFDRAVRVRLPLAADIALVGLKPPSMLQSCGRSTLRQALSLNSGFSAPGTSPWKKRQPKSSVSRTRGDSAAAAITVKRVRSENAIRRAERKSRVGDNMVTKEPNQ